MERINITALRHSAFYSPLLVTISGDYLNDEGLEAFYRPAEPGESVDDALRNGDFHLSQSAVATSFANLEQGKTCDIVHFAQINDRDGFFIVARKPAESFSWNDLEGKEVLVDHFFQPYAMLRYGLDRRSVDFNAIQVIDAGDVNAIEKAFRDGLGDYVHMQGPTAQQLEKDGIGYVVAAVGDAVGPVAFSSLCATRQWLETDMAQAFMQAYRKAQRFVLQAPAEDIARIEAVLLPGIDLEVLAATIRTYQQLGCWKCDAAISHHSYENLLDVFRFNRSISQRHAYDSCVVLPP